jgi:hypothetical protein
MFKKNGKKTISVAPVLAALRPAINLIIAESAENQNGHVISATLKFGNRPSSYFLSTPKVISFSLDPLASTRIAVALSTTKQFAINLHIDHKDQSTVVELATIAPAGLFLELYQSSIQEADSNGVVQLLADAEKMHEVVNQLTAAVGSVFADALMSELLESRQRSVELAHAKLAGDVAPVPVNHSSFKRSQRSLASARAHKSSANDGSMSWKRLAFYSCVAALVAVAGFKTIQFISGASGGDQFAGQPEQQLADTVDQGMPTNRIAEFARQQKLALENGAGSADSPIDTNNQQIEILKKMGYNVGAAPKGCAAVLGVK